MLFHLSSLVNDIIFLKEFDMNLFRKLILPTKLYNFFFIYGGQAFIIPFTLFLSTPIHACKKHILMNLS